ncbi:MAG: J domain-containing protein [Alphaproteobacteria bacterium]
MNDPYKILGVSKAVGADELKSAYHKLAKKLHPDLNPGKKDIEQRFKEVTAAYDLLSDPAKRAKFDTGQIDAMGNERGGFSRGGGDPFGRAGSRSYSHTSSGGGGNSDPFGSFSEDIFADLFGSKKRRGFGGFGGGPGGEEQPKARGGDVTYNMTIGFVESCLGTKQRVTLSSGKTVDVNIPPGSEEGTKLRLKGQGLAGLDGAGDALVEIKVAPHAFFIRKERDIYLDTPVSVVEALLGANIKVPTLEGSVSVKVPKGANTGTLLRLRGKGVPPYGSHHAGDFYVRLKIALPEPPDHGLTELIEKWAKKHTYNPREKLGWES